MRRALQLGPQLGLFLVLPEATDLERPQMGKQQLNVLGGVLLEVAHVRRTVPAMEGTLSNVKKR